MVIRFLITVVLGLIFGAATVSWTLSGSLTFLPFPTPQRAPARAQAVGAAPAPRLQGSPGGSRRGGSDGIGLDAALHGQVTMDDIATVHPRDILARHMELGVKELSFASLDGTPLYTVGLGDGTTRTFTFDGRPSSALDHERIAQIVRSAVPDPRALEFRTVEQYRLLLSRPEPPAAAAGAAGVDARRRRQPALYRSQDRRRRDVQRPQLGEAILLQRPALAEFPLAVQPPAALGHRRHRVHDWRHSVVRDGSRYWRGVRSGAVCVALRSGSCSRQPCLRCSSGLARRRPRRKRRSRRSRACGAHSRVRRRGAGRRGTRPRPPCARRHSSSGSSRSTPSRGRPGCATARWRPTSPCAWPRGTCISCSHSGPGRST